MIDARSRDRSPGGFKGSLDLGSLRALEQNPRAFQSHPTDHDMPLSRPGRPRRCHISGCLWPVGTGLLAEAESVVLAIQLHAPRLSLFSSPPSKFGGSKTRSGVDFLAQFCTVVERFGGRGH